LPYNEWIVPKKILKSAEWVFLAGVFFLIIRNNTYPWPIKRLSDILFALSALGILGYLCFSKEWPRLTSLLRKNAKGTILIFSGLSLATLISFLRFGVPINGEGILEFGRLMEAIFLVIAIGFFQSYNGNFFKKVIFAQLSTVVYAAAFFLPKSFLIAGDMGRLRLFENNPANVAYYSFISMTFVLVWLLARNTSMKKRVVLSALGVLYAGTLLWTQLRGVWVGMAISIIFIIGYTAYRSFLSKGRFKYIAVASAAVLSLFLLGFTAIPSFPKDLVLLRLVDPHFVAANRFDVYTENPGVIFKTITQQKPTFYFQDPSRSYLWKEYSKRLLESPWGFGASFYPSLTVIYNNKPLAPHNLILEILVLGGVFMLLGFFDFFIRAYKNIFFYLRQGEFEWPLYVTAALTGFLAAAMFDNLDSFRFLWVIIGLGLNYSLLRG